MMEEDTLPSPGRRRLLAAAVAPELERFLGTLRPKMNSYDEWFFAIRANDARRMEALLARGFDPNSIEPQLFDTSLIVAIRHKASKAIDLLLSLDTLDIDAQSRNGDTALMIAAWLSDTSTAIALIDKGAEINRPGWTALHYAAASGSVEIIRRLLEESAYIDAESPNGTTPLMMAARGGRRDALTLLLEEGADPVLRNERGMTAADFARAQGFSDLAQMLEERIAASGRAVPAPASPPSATDTVGVLPEEDKEARAASPTPSGTVPDPAPTPTDDGVSAPPSLPAQGEDKPVMPSGSSVAPESR